MAVAYTQIATISTDDHHVLQEFRASVGAQWPFLSDPGRIVQKDLDIQEYTDAEHDPMVPHTLVLKPGLVIHSIYNGYWFWGRPSTSELWQDLREASKEIRPDWDLGAPGLREAWRAGDRGLPRRQRRLQPLRPRRASQRPRPGAPHLLLVRHLQRPRRQQLVPARDHRSAPRPGHHPADLRLGRRPGRRAAAGRGRPR